MMIDEQECPGEGVIMVVWRTTLLDGRRHLGWEFASEPRLDPPLAIALLREVATELEANQPASQPPRADRAGWVCRP